MVAALHAFHSAFLSTDFKFIKDLPPSQHFPQLNVFPVKELVTYGIRHAAEAPLSQVSSCGVWCVCTFTAGRVVCICLLKNSTRLWKKTTQ
jgi:hypothetical protein